VGGAVDDFHPSELSGAFVGGAVDDFHPSERSGAFGGRDRHNLDSPIATYRRQT
jgi:hypothetical protein